jgi:hypothetical protein
VTRVTIGGVNEETRYAMPKPVVAADLPGRTLEARMARHAAALRLMREDSKIKQTHSRAVWLEVDVDK